MCRPLSGSPTPAFENPLTSVLPWPGGSPTIVTKKAVAHLRRTGSFLLGRIFHAWERFNAGAAEGWDWPGGACEPGRDLGCAAGVARAPCAECACRGARGG